MAYLRSARDQASFYAYRCPFGTLTIGSNGQAITQLCIGNVELRGINKPTTLTNACANELMEYFAGKRKQFDVAQKPYGSEFQKTIWHILQTETEYGKSYTASDIARLYGDENAARTIGVAIKKNPLAILIPTHRIINANGRFPDATKEQRIYSALLRHEMKNRENEYAN